MPKFCLFGAWSSWQKMLLDLVSLFFSFFFSISQNNSYEKKKILWWFGGNWSVNSWDSVIFMPNFGCFWSVGIMNFRPSFFNFFLFHFDFTEWFSWTKKEIMWWFRGNRSINGRDLAFSMPNFGLFGAWASWQKMLLDLVSSYFFVLISQNDSHEPRRRFCGGLGEIGP